MRTPTSHDDIMRLEGCSNAVRGGGEVLWKIAGSQHFKPTPGSQAESEAEEAIAHGLDAVLMPKTWRVIVEFATAAVELANALAVLLLEAQTVAVPVAARATIEHAQQACWLLEATHNAVGTRQARVTARQRAARAQLEELFSARHYRDTIEKFAKGAPPETDVREALADARKDLKDLKAYLVTAFGPGTSVEGEPSAWRIEGQALLVLTAASEWFFDTQALGSGFGVYDALSGWSHPTLWGIRDHQDTSLMDDGGVELTWTVRPDLMERLCATTSSTLYRLNIQLAGYFGWDEAPVHEWAENLNAWSPNLIRG
jgi:hypothetical protein